MDKEKKYRVWIDQVNACYIDVQADNEAEAADKAKIKWASDYADADVRDLQKI
jgi:hypothetical protein